MKNNVDDCKIESIVRQFKNFSSSKNKIYYYAKISDNLYRGYRGKIFYKSKSNLIKSLKASIKEYSGYFCDDNDVSEIYDIMIQNNVLSIGVLSV